MNFSRTLLKGSLLAALLVSAGNSHAVIVDFQSTGIADIKSTFNDSNVTPGSLTTLQDVAFYLDGSIQTPKTDGIQFSGGVLLQNPTEASGGGIVVGEDSIFYGTANSPTTNADFNDPAYGTSPQIIITINTVTDVTSVSGLLINGLNTAQVGNDPVEFKVEFFSDLAGINSLDMWTMSLASGSEPGNAMFESDTEGANIKRIEISATPFSEDPFDGEWDFLIDDVVFNAAVVPVPAALPLFLSALAGIGLFFRRKE